MSQPTKKRSPLLPIFLIVLVDILGLTIILPLLPFYAEHYGASPFVVGLLVATYAACQLISGPILGRVSDRVGRRPMLLVSQAGTFIGFLILAAANQLWIVFLSRIIDGFTAGNLSLAQAYISDVTAPENRSRAFGLIGISFGMGFLFGPAISGYLSQFGLAMPILAAAGLSATSILCTYFLLPTSDELRAAGHLHPGHAPAASEVPPPPPPGGKRLGILDWSAYTKYFEDPKLARLLIEFFLFVFGFACFTSGFALFAQRRYIVSGEPAGPKFVGYIFAYAGFLGVILQGGLIGRLVRRFGERNLAISGFLAMGVGYCVLGLTQNVVELLLITVVCSYGSGILRPTLTSLVTQATPRSEQGVVLGLTQSLNSVAQIIAPMIAGALIDRMWLEAWAVVAGGASMIGFFLSFRSRRSWAPNHTAAAS